MWQRQASRSCASATQHFLTATQHFLCWTCALESLPMPMSLSCMATCDRTPTDTRGARGSKDKATKSISGQMAAEDARWCNVECALGLKQGGVIKW